MNLNRNQRIGIIQLHANADGEVLVVAALGHGHVCTIYPVLDSVGLAPTIDAANRLLKRRGAKVINRSRHDCGDIPQDDESIAELVEGVVAGLRARRPNVEVLVEQPVATAQK